MIKELEALTRIRKELASHYDINGIHEWTSVEGDLDMIENALELLDAIERVPKVTDFNDDSISYVGHIIVIIDKEQFNKDQTELKAFEIIKEKNVDISWLRKCETLGEYNNVIGTSNHAFLIQEEFDGLKEVLNYD